MAQRGTRLEQTLGEQLDELLATVTALDAQTIAGVRRARAIG
jgi:hypothetical protein